MQNIRNAHNSLSLSWNPIKGQFTPILKLTTQDFFYHSKGGFTLCVLDASERAI